MNIINQRINATRIREQNSFSQCYWCDELIESDSDTEILPDKRGKVHKKCAEEFYLTKMADD